MPSFLKAECVSRRSLRALHAIETFRQQHDCNPSYRDLIPLLGCKSTSTVNYHVEHLLELGLLSVHRVGRRRYKGARSLILTRAGKKALRSWAAYV